MGKSEPEKRRRVAAMLTNGAGCTEISTQISIGRQTVYRWKDTLASGGIEALLAIPSRGRPNKLSDDQVNALRQALTHHPSDFNLTGRSWSLKLVSRLIIKLFDVGYGKSSVSRLLPELGVCLNSARRPRDR